MMVSDKIPDLIGLKSGDGASWILYDDLDDRFKQNSGLNLMKCLGNI